MRADANSRGCVNAMYEIEECGCHDSSDAGGIEGKG